jgi:hypothetical protein
MSKLELSESELAQVAGGSWWDPSSWYGGDSTGPYTGDDSGPGGCSAGGIPSGDGACWYPRDLGPVPQGWGDSNQNGGLGG